MKSIRKWTAMFFSVSFLALGLTGVLAESDNQIAGAITSGAQTDFPGQGTLPPPLQLGGLGLTSFPSNPGESDCGATNVAPCLVSVIPGPSGENITLPQNLWHQTGVGSEDYADPYSGDSYENLNTSGGSLSTTLTLPANTRAFYFYLIADGATTVTAHDSAGDVTAMAQAPFPGTEFGFFSQDESSITSITVVDSGEGSPSFTEDYFGRFGINVASPVTISAPSPTITYGGTVPTPAPIYSTGVATSTAANCVYSPLNPSAARTYTITCSGAADPDKIISYAGGGTSATGTLTIKKAPLTVAANDASMTYGDTFPTLGAQFSGLVNPDSSTSEDAFTTCSAGTPAPTTPGHYDINCVDTDSNYSATPVKGTLTISAAALTVTADNESMTYGGAYPTLTAHFSGLVNPDSMTSESVFTTCLSAPADSAMGTYPINCTDTDTNYSESYIKGTLTISPAPLTITAPSPTAPYGAVPTLTPTYSGLVNGDAAPSTPATCSTTATSLSPPGSYPVTCSGAVDPNYTFTYANGILKVVKAPTSFKVTETLTKTKTGTKAVLGETELPAGAKGFVFFQGPSSPCAIVLTGQPGEVTTCEVNYGPNPPYAVSGIFDDTDGDYLSSDSINEVYPHG